MSARRFRQCGECRGEGMIPGRDTWDSDARANSTDCPACGGRGGDYFPLHGYDYDAMSPKRLQAARAAFLRDRYDTREPDLWALAARFPTRAALAAYRYGEARQLAVSPLDRPLPDAPIAFRMEAAA